MPFIQSAAGAAQTSPLPILDATILPPQPTFEAIVRQYSAAGWNITSDGPCGVQVVAPKEMGAGHKIFLGIGFLTLLLYGVGMIFILIATINYTCFSPPERRLLQRW